MNPRKDNSVSDATIGDEQVVIDQAVGTTDPDDSSTAGPNMDASNTSLESPDHTSMSIPNSKKNKAQNRTRWDASIPDTPEPKIDESQSESGGRLSDAHHKLKKRYDEVRRNAEWDVGKLQRQINCGTCNIKSLFSTKASARFPPKSSMTPIPSPVQHSTRIPESDRISSTAPSDSDSDRQSPTRKSAFRPDTSLNRLEAKERAKIHQHKVHVHQNVTGSDDKDHPFKWHTKDGGRHAIWLTRHGHRGCQIDAIEDDRSVYFTKCRKK